MTLIKLPEVKIFCMTMPDGNKSSIPTYKKEGDAGFDITTYVPDSHDSIILPPNTQVKLNTYLKMAIPFGWELQIRPRSSFAKHPGLHLVNTPGTIDSGYRGEILVVLRNIGDTDLLLNSGSAYVQGILARAPQLEFIPVDSEDDLGETDRGVGGFGSTELFTNTGLGGGPIVTYYEDELKTPPSDSTPVPTGGAIGRGLTSPMVYCPSDPVGTLMPLDSEHLEEQYLKDCQTALDHVKQLEEDNFRRMTIRPPTAEAALIEMGDLAPKIPYTLEDHEGDRMVLPEEEEKINAGREKLKDLGGDHDGIVPPDVDRTEKP